MAYWYSIDSSYCGEPVSVQSNIERLKEFGTYKDGWDGLFINTKAMPPSLIQDCIDMIPKLIIQPEVQPTVPTGITFRWTLPYNWPMETRTMEIRMTDVHADFTFTVQAEHVDDEPEVFTRPHDVNEINDVLGKQFAEEIGILAKLQTILSRNEYAKLSKFIENGRLDPVELYDSISNLIKEATP